MDRHPEPDDWPAAALPRRRNRSVHFAAALWSSRGTGHLDDAPAGGSLLQQHQLDARGDESALLHQSESRALWLSRPVAEWDSHVSRAPASTYSRRSFT